jgi:hypothetical protein
MRARHSASNRPSSKDASSSQAPRRRASFALLVSAVALATFCEGCASVAAYDRGRLAHPTMAKAHAGSVARDHVYAVQEGAMGGSGEAASGCGCN